MLVISNKKLKVKNIFLMIFVIAFFHRHRCIEPLTSCQVTYKWQFSNNRAQNIKYTQQPNEHTQKTLIRIRCCHIEHNILMYRMHFTYRMKKYYFYLFFAGVNRMAQIPMNHHHLKLLQESLIARNWLVEFCVCSRRQ